MTQASKQTNCYVISPIGYTCIQRLLIFSKVNISIFHIQSFHIQGVGFAKHTIANSCYFKNIVRTGKGHL